MASLILLYSNLFILFYLPTLIPSAVPLEDFLHPLPLPPSHSGGEKSIPNGGKPHPTKICSRTPSNFHFFIINISIMASSSIPPPQNEPRHEADTIKKRSHRLLFLSIFLSVAVKILLDCR